MLNYHVRDIPKSMTHSWLMNIHYAKRLPSIIYAFGLFHKKDLVGVITYGKPASPFLCVGVCGEQFADNVFELNRVCLLNNKKNECSYFVSNTLRLLPKPKIIVSYADTEMGHFGTVYKACNFIYTGATKSRTDVDTGDKHARHIKGLDYSKRKTRSAKHRYIYFVGNRKQRKVFKQHLRYEIKPYPVGVSDHYEIAKTPEIQMEIF